MPTLNEGPSFFFAFLHSWRCSFWDWNFQSLRTLRLWLVRWALQLHVFNTLTHKGAGLFQPQAMNRLGCNESLLRSTFVDYKSDPQSFWRHQRICSKPSEQRWFTLALDYNVFIYMYLCTGFNHSSVKFCARYSWTPLQARMFSFRLQQVRETCERTLYIFTYFWINANRPLWNGTS